MFTLIHLSSCWLLPTSILRRCRVLPFAFICMVLLLCLFWEILLVSFISQVLPSGGLWHLLRRLCHCWALFLSWLVPLLSVASPCVVLQAPYRATECRLSTSTRPPPDPDSCRQCHLFWLIVGCLATLLSSYVMPVLFFPKTMNSADPLVPLPSDDSKPTFAELESMLHKAELLDSQDQASLSWATSASPGEGGVLTDDHASLAQIITAAVASALRTT